MRKHIRFILIAVTGILTVAAPGFACECLPVSASGEGLRNSTFVFAGTVEHKSRFSLPQVHKDYKEFRLKFRVIKYWKGKVGKYITVRTPATFEDCGFDFRKGQSYLVYAVGTSSPFTTACSRSILLKSDRAESDMLFLGDANYP